MVWANRVDLDQTAPLGAVWSGSTVCHSVCIVWAHYSVVKRYCSNFRIITAIFSCVRIFTKFMVVHIPHKCPAGTFSIMAGCRISERGTYISSDNFERNYTWNTILFIKSLWKWSFSCEKGSLRNPTENLFPTILTKWDVKNLKCPLFLLKALKYIKSNLPGTNLTPTHQDIGTIAWWNTCRKDTWLNFLRNIKNT